jgi:hypothetical protein
VVSVYVFNAPPPPPPRPVLPVINIYALDAEGVEVAAGSPNTASFRVTHDFPASATVSFLFAIGGTAREGLDYTLSSAGTLGGGMFGRWFTFPAGATEAQIVVTPVDDLLIENAETVTMSLYTPPFIGFNEGTIVDWDWQASFGFWYGASHSASVNVLSDDTAPPPFPLITITATDPVGTETVDGSDTAVFTVTRTSGPTDVPLTVNYALTIPPKQTIYVTEPRPAMAQNGVDFPALTGTVTIPVGATSADIVIAPIYDLLSEVPELLQITLRPSVAVWPAPGGYVIDANTVANVSIHDAVLAAGTPVVSLGVTDAFAYWENFPTRTAAFSVGRTGDLTASLDVHYTVGGTATNGVDYVTLSGVVTIPAGAARASIIVNPYLGSSLLTETVSITLDIPPLDVIPPPYAISAPLTAAISISHHPYLTSKRRAIVLRRHHLILPLPTPPAPAAALTNAIAAPAVWTVEASTDLVNWEEIGTTDPSGEFGDFVDVNAGDFAQRFYRFRPVPASAP